MPQLRQLEFNGGRSDPRNRRSSSTYDIDGAKDAADENRRCRTEKRTAGKVMLFSLYAVIISNPRNFMGSSNNKTYSYFSIGRTIFFMENTIIEKSLQFLRLKIDQKEKRT